MKVCGIIAEYNPLHSGHIYHIKETRKQLGADMIIAVISGSFVQRGEPAILDKYIRTEAILRSGADIVIEMPVCASLGSSEYFAKGAIDILNSTNSVTNISFGSECGDIDKLRKIANILVDESEDFSLSVKTLLAKGISYPLALSQTVAENFPELSGIMDKPNNLLGIEYLKALIKTKSSIVPFTVSRDGLGYNETDFSANKHANPSATFLREKLINNQKNDFINNLPSEMTDALKQAYNLDYLSENICYLTENDFSDVLMYSIIYNSDFKNIADINTDILNRINNIVSTPMDFESFANSVKTRNITMSRVKRMLFHSILGITYEDMDRLKSEIYAPYINILGFKKSASSMIKTIKENADCPVLCIPSDIDNLSGYERTLYEKDLNAYKLYRQIHFRKHFNNSYQPRESGIVII